MVTLKKFKKILILSGGISEERDISRSSANHVYETIKNEARTKILNVSDNADQLLINIQKFNPDYIIIANDTNKHLLELEKICKLTSGKTVLVEKPIFEKFIKFYPKKNRFFVTYNMRFHPILNYLKLV